MRTGNGFGGGPRAAAAQLARAVQIATILSASGFGWLVQALGLGGCVSPATAWSAHSGRARSARTIWRRTFRCAFLPSDAVAELAQYTRRELDFRREARTVRTWVALSTVGREPGAPARLATAHAQPARYATVA